MNIPLQSARPTALLALLLTATVLAGCAAGGASRSPAASADPAVLETLAVERWQHLIDGRFAEAWEMLTPGYQATKPQDEYAREMKGRPVKWTKVLWLDTECPQPTRCKVKVRVDYRVRMAVQNVGYVEAYETVSDTWIYAGGRWAYLPPEVVR